MTSLVVQTSFLGDVILTTPLMTELAKRGPVDVVTTPAGATLLQNHPAVRNVIVYDKADIDRGVVGFGRAVSRIRSAGMSHDGIAGYYGAAYLAQGSLRSAALAMSAGIRERVGFASSSGRALYTIRVPYRGDRHHAERLWWLSMSECADEPDRSQITPTLHPGDAERAAVDHVLVGVVAPLVVLAPGSSWGTKRWPYFAELATRIADHSFLVVIGGTEDRAAGDAIMARVPEECGMNAAGTLTLLESAELIGRAVAVVTNDSAPTHIASAMGTPTVTLFGPTVPDFGFGPLALPNAALGRDELACRPCDRHGPERCPLGHWRCMRELSPDGVFEAVMQLLPAVRA